MIIYRDAYDSEIFGVHFFLFFPAFHLHLKVQRQVPPQAIMQDPVRELRHVISSIVEPRESAEIQANIDRYFTPSANIIHPMFNSPKEAGREGLKAGYKMLRVLTINNKMIYHAVAFDHVVTRKGLEHQVAMIDATEQLQLRFLPLPASLNPVFHPRFIVRVDMVKNQDNGLFYIDQQEDNLATDFGRSGLPSLGLKFVSDNVKWALGVGTLIVAGTFNRLGLF